MTDGLGVALRGLGDPCTLLAHVHYWPTGSRSLMSRVRLTVLRTLRAFGGLTLVRRSGWRGRTPGGAEGAAERLRALAARDRWSADRKHACLADLAADVGVDWEGFVGQRLLPLMTPEEIAGLDPGIADVQLPTHRHRMPDERELFLREVEDNRSALARCGRPKEHLTHFCYPSGVYARHHLPWLAEAGVTSATTCEPGLASPRSATLTLPRFIDTHLTPEIEFDAWAAGVRGILKRPG